jgi:hypothetical protein
MDFRRTVVNSRGQKMKILPTTLYPSSTGSELCIKFDYYPLARGLKARETRRFALDPVKTGANLCEANQTAHDCYALDLNIYASALHSSTTIVPMQQHA